MHCRDSYNVVLRSFELVARREHIGFCWMLLPFIQKSLV